MSRDWKPFENWLFHKEMNIPSLFESNIVWHVKKEDGTFEEFPLHSEQDKVLGTKFYHFGIAGPSVITALNKTGYFDELGQTIAQQVEDLLNGKESEDKEFNQTTLAWYQGELDPGRYMDDNTEAFINYLVKYKKKKGKET